MKWDSIVIGSGVAGLTAGLTLARGGQKVLVVEQHTAPPGWSSSFTVDGFSFGPLVHAVGELHEGGRVRALLEGLGVAGALEFSEVNAEAMEHIVAGLGRFDQPRGAERWEHQLVDAFPEEREGLAEVFSVLRRVQEELPRGHRAFRFPAVLLSPFRVPTLMRWRNRSVTQLLERSIRSPALRAALAARCAQFGVGPSRVSVPTFAALAAHYDHGAAFPRGGARQVPLALIHGLERAGGQLRRGARVAEILVERNRVVGVRLTDGERITAANVVCNASSEHVVGSLLAPRHRTYDVHRKKETYPVSLVSVTCAVDMDLRAMGQDSGNTWLFRTADLDGLYRRMEVNHPRHEVDGLFLSIPSLKDHRGPPRKFHTVEMFTVLPYSAFEQFAGRSSRDRGDAFEALKKDLGQRVIRAAEQLIPGLGAHVHHVEVGTPVSCVAPPRSKSPTEATRLKGLYFCGATTLGHGMGTAALSGLEVGACVLGVKDPWQCLVPGESTLKVVAAERHVERRWTRSRPPRPAMELARAG